MRLIDCQRVFNALPGLYLVVTPDYRLVAASTAVLEATMNKREDILGRDAFEIFPDNPMAPHADSVCNIRVVAERVLASKIPETIPRVCPAIHSPRAVAASTSWRVLLKIATSRRMRTEAATPAPSWQCTAKGAGGHVQ